MTTGPSEARRHAERRAFDLVEIWIDGVRGEDMPDNQPLASKEIAALMPVTTRKRKKPLPVAIARNFELDDDEPTISEQARRAGVSRQVASYRLRTHGDISAIRARKDQVIEHEDIEPVDMSDTLDSESIAAFWDFTADTLPEFVEWLTDGMQAWECRPAASVEYLSEVTGNPWTGFVVTKRPIGAPAEPRAPVADAIEHVEPAPVAIVNTYSGMRADQFAAHFMHSQRADQPKGITEADITLSTTCTIAGEPIHAEPSEPAQATTAPEQVEQPATQPVRAPQRPMTGKQLRKLEKQQRRAERGQPAPERPTIGKSPRAIAVTARALVQVAFELNGFTA